jgi:ribonuclease-3
MARGLGLPAYRLAERGGSAHAPRFRVEVAAAGRAAGAEAGSKREAERRAAAALLALLETR